MSNYRDVRYGPPPATVEEMAAAMKSQLGHDGKKYVLGPLEAALRKWRKDAPMCRGNDDLMNAIDAYFGDPS